MKANQMNAAGVVITRLACVIAGAIVVLVGLLQYHIDNAYLCVGALVVIGCAGYGIYLTGKGDKKVQSK